MKYQKNGWYERTRHTGILCPYCGAEQDQCGQTGHKTGCPALQEEDKMKYGISDKYKMRKVKTFKWERLDGNTYFSKVEDGEGVFVQYGTDYEEFESGPGNYTTAVVEMPDGTVKNLPLDLIQFI